MRAVAFSIAMAVGVGFGVLAILIGSPFSGYLLGMAAAIAMMTP